jgi:hypothetical protein
MPPRQLMHPASGTYPTSLRRIHDPPLACAPSDPTPADMWGQPADPRLVTGHHPRARRKTIVAEYASCRSRSSQKSRFDDAFTVAGDPGARAVTTKCCGRVLPAEPRASQASGT